MKGLRSPVTSADLGGRSAYLPLDAAFEYLCRQPLRVLPLYLLAMLPTSLAVLHLFDIVASQYRSGVASAAALLTLTMPWRWIGLAVMQRRVQEDVRGEPAPRVRQRWIRILFMRLYSFIFLTWGSLLVAPAYYGLFLSVLATPTALETDQPAHEQLKRTFGWMNRNFARLARVAVALGALTLLLYLTVIVTQYLMLQMILPYILGLDVADMQLTMQSWSWVLSLCYLLLLALDLWWQVSGVMLFYDLQSRRVGNDLRARLRLLEAQAP